MEKNRQAFNVDIISDEEKEDLLEDYIRQVKAFPAPSPEEEEALIEQMLLGNEDARATLIESRLRIVLLIAELYRDRGLPFEDIIMAGNNGLIEAMKNYRPPLELDKFAALYIVKAIRDVLSRVDRGPRIPAHKVDTYRRVIGAARKYVMKEGREPTDRELADELGLPIETVAEIMDPVRWVR